MRNILFVDDEPKILEGLKRMLYPLRGEWHMSFATSGREALELMAKSPIDVLVTDLRMPGMTGIELLAEVIRRHPQVVRMVLSGTADQDATLRSVMLAHQYLVKPCDAATLRATVHRAFALRDMLSDSTLKQLISQIHSLPSIPAVYLKMMETLRSPHASAREIGNIVSQDIAMTAKVLQLVNSSFFGIRRQITNPAEAVVYLGIETIRALALSVSAFSQFKAPHLSCFSIQDLSAHCLKVATLARLIGRSMGAPKNVSDDTMVAGLLHDLGKLVLASNYPDRYDVVLGRARKEGVPDGEAERDAFGTTHSEVGTYLLWLWGLSDIVTEAIAFHHSPARCLQSTWRPVTAVHVADALIRNGGGSGMDVAYLTRMGLMDELPKWKRVYEEMSAGETRAW